MIGTVSRLSWRPSPSILGRPLMLCSMLHNCPWTATPTQVNRSGKAPLNRYVTRMDPSGRSPATDARNSVTDFARLIRRPRWAPPTIDRALQLLMLIALLPAALLIVRTLVQGEIHARDDAYDKVAILARITAEKAEVVLDQNQAMLQRLAERRLVRLLDPDQCDPLIDTFVALHRNYTNIGIRDLRANSVCSHIDNPPAQADVARFPWFVEGIRSGDFTVGDAFLGRPSGRWLSVLTYPIRAADGNVAGLVVFSMDLLKAYRRVMGAPSTAATVALVDRNNAVLMRSADLEGWIGKPFLASFNGIPDAVQTAAEGRFPAVGNDGKRWLYSFVTVKGTGWRVFAGLPEDAVLAEHRLQQAYTIALWLCALALGLAATWVVGRYIARPIHRLAETTRKIASGETSARAEIAGPREIEEVVNDFNHMLDVRAQHREEKAALVTRNDQLVQLARDIFLLIAPDGHVVDGNDAAIAAYGYTREEFRHLDVSDLRPPSHRDSMPAQWNAAAQPGGTLFETVHQRKDGTTFPVEISSQVVTIDGQPYRQSFVRDISARKETERKAREAHEHLRMLTTRLSEVRERETARLAREIHDELGQRLTGLAMEITWLASRLDPGQKALRDKIASALGNLDATVEAVRNIAGRLRPAVLDHLGLVPAIEWQVKQFQKQTGLDCEFVANTGDPMLPPEQAIALFRIIQEAMTNAARHAAGTRVDVSLFQDSGTVTLEIRDDGKGIAADWMSRTTSLGLLGMQERAREIGATFTIEGHPGRGTVVMVRVECAEHSVHGGDE